MLFLALINAPAHAAQAPAAEAGKTAGAREKTITVTSDSMEADNTANTVVFRGNVAAREDFLICSDELYLNYGTGMDVDRLVAVGRVEIYHGGREATSERAEYIRGERTLILTGSPVVNQCADTVRGQRIIFYLDEDRAMVESGEGGRVRAVIVPDKKCPEAAGKASGEEARCKRAR